MAKQSLTQRALSRLKKEVEDYTREWLDGIEKDTLRFRVHGKLDNELHKLVLAAIGFEADYNGYRISSSKGSPIRDFLQEDVKTHTQEWIKTNLVFGLGLSVDEKLQNQLKRVYSRYYKEALLDYVSDLAREHAEEDTRKLFPQLVKKLRETG